MGKDDTDSRLMVKLVKDGLEAAGTKILYEQYAPLDTTDYSPYLTKIKFEKPDVLYIYSGQNEMYMSIAKQIMELGGVG